MPTLSQTLSELDWVSTEQQEAVIQVMSFYGCFGDSPDHLLSESEVRAKLTGEISVAEVNAAMQTHLKRSPEAERAMLGLDARFDSNPSLRTELMTRYRALGMLDELLPPMDTEYDAILLLGSSQPNFTTRLDTLRDVESSRHVSGPIYLLGSDRELWPLNEPIMTTLLAKRSGMAEEVVNARFVELHGGEANLAAIRTKPKELNATRAAIYAEFRASGVTIPTEADMMNAVLEKSALREVPHTKIEAGKRADGSRANTEDTVVKFLEQYKGKRPAKILVISTQPEAMYQIEPVRKILTPDRGFASIDIAAKAVSERVNSLVVNDSIARKVYSRLEREKSRTASIAPDSGHVGGGGGFVSREEARKANGSGIAR